MSTLRTINLILRRFKLQVVRTDKVGLTYPQTNWKLSLLTSSLWAGFAFYLASFFSIDPKATERSISCMFSKSVSNFSVLLFVASLLAALFYFVLQHGAGRISARAPLRWFTARFSVAFALLFSGFLSKLGAVATGLGAYLAFVNLEAGIAVMLLGSFFLGFGLLFRNHTLPMIFKIGPALARWPVARAFLAMAASVAAALLVVGLLTGAFNTEAVTAKGCHLVVRYE